MSVQFGKYNFDGKPLDPGDLAQVRLVLAPYGPDGEGFVCKDNFAVIYRAFHTTQESRREQQPYISASGVVITWDGRLDNREDLTRGLEGIRVVDHADVELAAAAYERWGSYCFARLVGDWALTIWDPTKKVLFLARDFLGTRQLFYSLEPNGISWSTVLDPLVILRGGSHEISEQFIAGYLSTYPGTHLTPYRDIHAVPPSTFVQLESTRTLTQAFWRFNPSQICYQNDADYEQHFRSVFGEAVRRRLRADSPVLAELSGGMDSSSIVCMADQLVADANVRAPRLNTISYYDDNEPNWNERPYFSLVEKKRGCQGCHVDVGDTEGALLPPDNSVFLPLPGYDQMGLKRIESLGRCLEATQSRVLLSGIGGDEFLGGVPTPIPDLQDLFVSFRFIRFGHRLLSFSLAQRRPLFHLLLESVEEFLPQTVRHLYKQPPIVPWLTPSFVRRNTEQFWADLHRTEFLGARPSFQFNLNTLNHLRRQLNCVHLNTIARCQVTYPYLDRDLLAFLFAIPRDQFVRPGQRRSLMRRALAGTVPPEIFARKRKAFMARHPLLSIHFAMRSIEQLLDRSLVAAYGWVDPAILQSALQSVRRGEPEFLIPILRTLRLEIWLRDVVYNRALFKCKQDKEPCRDTFNQLLSRFSSQGDGKGQSIRATTSNKFSDLQPARAE